MNFSLDMKRYMNIGVGMSLLMSPSGNKNMNIYASMSVYMSRYKN